MSFKKVSQVEWNALQTAQVNQDTRIAELERQLGIQSSSSGTGAQTPAQATTTEDSPPTMDDRVDGLEAEEQREDQAEQARREGKPLPSVTVESGAPPPPPLDLTTPDQDDRLDPLPPASDLSRDGTAPTPAYPPLGDEPDKQPGFVMTTAGNDYKWIGGDAAKVVAGDYRSITAGERVDFVGGAKKATVVGSATNKYLSGKEDTIHGPMNQNYTGNSTRHVLGDETRTMVGNRKFTITGDRDDKISGQRQDTTVGGRNETVYGYKMEQIIGGKSEICAGAGKHSSILGAKVESMDGVKIDIGKALRGEKFATWQWDIAGGIKAQAAKAFWKIVSVDWESVDFKIDASDINLCGTTKQEGDMTVEGELKTTKKANIDNGAITT